MNIKDHLTIFASALSIDENVIDDIKIETKKSNLNYTQDTNTPRSNVVLSDIPILAQMQDFALKIHKSIYTDIPNDLSNDLSLIHTDVLGKKINIFNGYIDGLHIFIFCKFSNKILANSILLKTHTIIDKSKTTTNTDTIYVDINDFYNIFIKHISSIVFFINKLNNQTIQNT